MVTARALIDTASASGSSTRTAAPSPVLPRAMLTATGARIRPITMITGPVTIGGKMREISRVPRQRTRRLSSK